MKTNRFDPSVKLLGVGPDVRTGTWHRVLEVRDLDGHKKSITVPFANTSQRDVLAVIGGAGYPVPILARERAALLKELADVTSAPRLTVTSSSGWVGDRAFLTPLRSYTRGDDALVLTGNLQDGHRFHVSGSLKAWQQRVAKPAFENSNAMFAIMLALVGPTMRFANASSAGFHLVGPSSIGKTTVLVTAGSVWGGHDGPLGFARTWHATSNALDLFAGAHSETFLGLDESKLAGETPKEAATTILHAVHRLAGGQEKARQTDRGPGLRWRVPYLGSSEESQDEMARAAAQTLTWGQRVRSSDITADAGRGLGVWEELHSTVITPALFADRLRNAALEYHGAAGDAFLERLVDATCTQQEWVTKFLSTRIKKFLSAVGSSGWDTAQTRIATRFALVYAAGSLAFKFGVLPWDWKHRLWAVTTCYQRIIVPAEALAPHTASDVIAAVRSYISGNKDRFIDLGSKTAITKDELDAAYGVIYPSKKGKVEYLIANRRFRNAVCAGLPAERVFEDLCAAGLMNVQQGGKRGVTRDFPRPLKRARVISIKHEILERG
jgi:putative DNA primase/helicase